MPKYIMCSKETKDMIGYAFNTKVAGTSRVSAELRNEVKLRLELHGARGKRIVRYAHDARGGSQQPGPALLRRPDAIGDFRLVDCLWRWQLVGGSSSQQHGEYLCDQQISRRRSYLGYRNRLSRLQRPLWDCRRSVSPTVRTRGRCARQTNLYRDGTERRNKILFCRGDLRQFG